MNQFKDHFLGKVQARLHPGHDLPEVPAHRRHRERRPHGLSPHVFRDAGQFQLRRLLQARGDQLGLGVSDQQEVAGPRSRPAVRVTVYLDDDEAADIWARDIKLPPERIKRMGEDDNFWPAGAPSQGPDGVCGPCSEIFYKPDGAARWKSGTWCSRSSIASAIAARTTCGRCPARTSIPAWAWSARPRCCKASTRNFHIDILRPLVEAAGEVCGVKYDPASENGRRLRRIADHVRACTFAIHENVYPGPNKEKYVVKRLLRRAVLDGRQMGVHEPFLHKLVPLVAEMMTQPYPELGETATARGQGHRKGREQLLRHDRRRTRPHRAALRRMKSERRDMVSGAEAADMYTHARLSARAVRNLGGRAQPGLRLGGLSARRWNSTASTPAAATKELFQIAARSTR